MAVTGFQSVLDVGVDGLEAGEAGLLGGADGGGGVAQDLPEVEGHMFVHRGGVPRVSARCPVLHVRDEDAVPDAEVAEEIGVDERGADQM